MFERKGERKRGTEDLEISQSTRDCGGIRCENFTRPQIIVREELETTWHTHSESPLDIKRSRDS